METSARHPFEVLIVGAGVAGLEATLALNDLAGERVHVTLLEPGQVFRYRPMSVREPFTGTPASTYPLDRILPAGSAEVIHDAFKWIDPAQRIVHTDGGRKLSYDAVLLAIGARTHPRFKAVLTVDVDRMGEQLADLVAQLDSGRLQSVAYLVPSLPIWSLPAYELALMTATRAAAHGHGLEVTVITPEDAPLAALGAGASHAVSQLLSQCGVTAITGSRPQVRDAHTIELFPSLQTITADRVISLPELYAPAVPGIPTSAERGFITVDWDGAVHGLERVYAAGDITDSPVKNGGLSAEQALAAAEAIATLAGVEVPARERVRMLDVMLIGGPQPLFIRSRMLDAHGIDVEVSHEPLWSPVGKIDAHYLAPRLAAVEAAPPSALGQTPGEHLGAKDPESVLGEHHRAVASA